jgi:hypothetical protein
MSRLSAADKYNARRKQLLEKERRLLFADNQGVFETVLATAKSYGTAMASLEYQRIFMHLSSWPETRCERAFFPQKDEFHWRKRFERPFVTLDSGKPLGKSDMILFHISHERDYENVLRMMKMSGIPLRSENRAGWPIVIAAGICVTANPLPLAPFMDAFIIGETEPALGPVLDTIKSLGAQGAGMSKILRWVAQLPGIYVPSQHGVSDVTTTIMRQWAGADAIGARSCVCTPKCDLGPLSLLEIARGCPYNCRFCMAGYIYLPYRENRLEDLMESLDDLPESMPVCLMGCSPPSHSAFGDIVKYAEKSDHKVTLGWLRPEDELQLRNMCEDYSPCTVTVAPEAGTESLRKVIGKSLSDEKILDAFRKPPKEAERGRLYFMIGLPFEEEEDRKGIVDLVTRVREVTDLPLVVSIAPFVPRPWTAFQWSVMVRPRRLRERMEPIEAGLKRISKVKLEVSSFREGHIVALLARGGADVARALEERLKGLGWNTAFSNAGIKINWVFKPLKPGRKFGWDFLNMGFGYTRLTRELQLAVSANQCRFKAKPRQEEEE